jgi:hypothetical protein
VGTPVTVVASAKGLDITPPFAQFAWNGALHIVEFDATVPDDAGPTTVVVKYDVSVDGITVARIRHDLEIGPAPAAAAPQLVLGVRPATTAFASYASEDRARVIDRVAAIRNFAKVDVWLDTLSLHPNDQWKDAITHEILARDVFLLFWSRAAAASPWVDWEWRSALRDKGETALQLQPLDPPSEAPPPEELQHLHFGDPLIDVREITLLREGRDRGESVGDGAPSSAPIDTDSGRAPPGVANR